jgi:hypothetical protein
MSRSDLTMLRIVQYHRVYERDTSTAFPNQNPE